MVYPDTDLMFQFCLPMPQVSLKVRRLFHYINVKTVQENFWDLNIFTELFC